MVPKNATGAMLLQLLLRYFKTPKYNGTAKYRRIPWFAKSTPYNLNKPLVL